MLGELELFLKEKIKCAGKEYRKDDIKPVIDVLECMADMLRYRHNYVDKTISLGRFINGTISVDSGVLTYNDASHSSISIHPMKPGDIQPHLLVYLLLHYHDRYTILDTINDFVRKLQPQLSILDFEKTGTGVTRCKTNTRFAANVLRNHGLLKNSTNEHYKTWKLSIAGLVVAADLVMMKTPLPITNMPGSTTLHHQIRESWKEIHCYEKFVCRLETICNKELDIFENFREVLLFAYSRLDKYWEVINSGRNKKEVAERSRGLIMEIENCQGIEKFYEEFSIKLNIVDVLKRTTTGF